MADQPRKYAIGISYQSKMTQFARYLAKALAEQLGGEQHVFFDKFHQNEFVGADAKSKLTRIYCDEVDLVVPLFSADYNQGDWPTRWSDPDDDGTPAPRVT